MEALIPISSQSFDSAPPSLRVIEHDHSTMFAALQIAHDVQVTISWRSELVTPFVLPVGQSNVWIGVDQRVACVARTGTTVFSIGLDGLLLEIKQLPNFFVIVCDSGLIAVNRDYSIRALHALHELPNGVDLINGCLTVELVSGEIINLGPV